MALLGSDAIILFSPPEWGWLRIPTAITLVFILPGLAWLPALNWMHSDQALERLTLIGGVSSVLSALTLFITLWVVVPFTETPVLIGLNLLIVVGVLVHVATCKLGIKNCNLQSLIYDLIWPNRKVLLILIAIIAVAALTRTTRLGYAEFHEDALENMRLIVRAYKGESYAAFLDSKGPIHWLLPASLWFLNGWLNETIARVPFTITSLLLVPLVYLLGWRLSQGNQTIGLIAAGIVALNGFFVAYARHVENQSLIVFWGALAMWFGYRTYRENIPTFPLYIALCLAIGLIAHPDVLLYLPVFGYMLVMWVDKARRAVQNAEKQSASSRQSGEHKITSYPFSFLPFTSFLSLIFSLILFVTLTALFYVPYLTDPQIGLVYQYFAEDRIGQSFLYNRVPNLFEQDRHYSTRYYAPILLFLLIWLLARNFAKIGSKGLIILGCLGGAISCTLIVPEWWLIRNINLAFIPYALLTLVVLWLPSTKFELKILFLWMMAPLGALLFLAQDAADHVQIAYPAWALLAGFGLVDLWQTINRLESTYPKIALTIKGAIITLISLVSLVIVSYQYLTFNAMVTTYWQAKVTADSNPNSLYNWLYGSIQRPRKLFGNPRLGGWKAVGYLHETGELSGDFRSINESFAVPIWYTYQTPRSCYEDPANYWIRRDHKGWPEEVEQVTAQGYHLTRVILVDNQPKLHLYERSATIPDPKVINLETYRQQFDLLATPARFAQADPIHQTTSLNFDDKLLLEGYNQPINTAHAGQLLPVTVFWSALAPMNIRYRAFIHLVDAAGNRWAQHDDDPACRLLTTDMRSGQTSSRQFRLPIDPTTPPGSYQLILGMYEPESFQRLPIWDNVNQQTVGDVFTLGTVTIQ